MCIRDRLELQENGLADNTYIIFTSDNGYQLGHHRVSNKLDPFNRSTNVPTIVWGPGVRGGVKANHLLAHIDICPTILELGGATIPSLVDGKSFVPVIKEPTMHAPDLWRDAVIIENWSDKQNFGRAIPCAYSALRGYEDIYVEWATGDNEYYDLSHDPFQINNIWSSLSSSRKNELANQLRTSRNHPMAPITTITGPDLAAPVKQFFRIEGAAEDDQRVVRTSLAIRSINTGRYFDGFKWTDDWSRLNARMSAQDRQMAYWFKGVNIPAETDGIDFLLVMAFSTDNSGNFTLPFTWRVVPLDQVGPTTTLNVLSNMNYVMPGEIVVTGNSYDNFETDRIRVVVRDQYDQKYWNGTDWQSDWTYTESPVDPDGGTWETDFPATSKKRYQFLVRSIDRAGNVQQIASSTVFIAK